MPQKDSRRQLRDTYTNKRIEGSVLGLINYTEPKLLKALDHSGDFAIFKSFN